MQFRPSLRHGRAILHEAFWFEVELERVTTPPLLGHGTQDTFVPIATIKDNVPRIRGTYRLHEVESAHHRFAMRDGPTYARPQSEIPDAATLVPGVHTGESSQHREQPGENLDRSNGTLLLTIHPITRRIQKIILRRRDDQLRPPKVHEVQAPVSGDRGTVLGIHPGHDLHQAHTEPRGFG
jgi:hypothetical protein